MNTQFKPKPGLFRPCCGNCAYSFKIGKKYVCGKNKDSYKHYTYAHLCDETGTDDGVQLEMKFDECDGNKDE